MRLRTAASLTPPRHLRQISRATTLKQSGWTCRPADLDQAWANRGYVISRQHASLLRWLIKLRNRQEKYNLIVRPTLWTELEPKHTSFPKTHADLTAASPTCFLFRNAAVSGKRNESDIAKPITSGRMDLIWGLLLEELETRLDAPGVRDVQGEKIVLIKARQSALHTTFFPLHSLRVSLLTALAFEGGVTLQTLMQLAGHSRILMAIYYQKMGSVLMGEELEKAGATLAEKADRSLLTWLKQRALDDVAKQIAAADERGLRNAIPEPIPMEIRLPVCHRVHSSRTAGPKPHPNLSCSQYHRLVDRGAEFHPSDHPSRQDCALP